MLLKIMFVYICVCKGTKDYDLRVKRSGSRLGEPGRQLLEENICISSRTLLSFLFLFSIWQSRRKSRKRRGNSWGRGMERAGEQALKSRESKLSDKQLVNEAGAKPRNSEAFTEGKIKTAYPREVRLNKDILGETPQQILQEEDFQYSSRTSFYLVVRSELALRNWIQ